MARNRIYMNFSVELESIAHVSPNSVVQKFLSDCVEEEIRRRVEDFVVGMYNSTVTLDVVTMEEV